MIERIEKILAKAELGGAFLVNVHPQYSNLYEVKHNARRASAAHERYDMHLAGEALRKGGFDADISGLTLLVRKAVRQAPRLTCDDYEANESRYAGQNDIEYADMF